MGLCASGTLLVPVLSIADVLATHVWVPIDLSGTSREDCATKDGLAVKWVATANNRTGFGGRWEKTRKASSAGSYAMSSSEALLRGKGNTSLPPHPEKTSGSFPGPTRQ